MIQQRQKSLTLFENYSISKLFRFDGQHAYDLDYIDYH